MIKYIVFIAVYFVTCGITFSQDLAVGVIDKDYQSDKIIVRYGVINYDPNSLYLMEILYHEMTGYDGEGLLFPTSSSLSGDAGLYAFRGNDIKEFTWNFGLQGRTWLGDGEFNFNLIEINDMYSASIVRLYGRQHKVHEKLQEAGIPIRRVKKLQKRLDRITNRVNNRVQKYQARRR